LKLCIFKKKQLVFQQSHFTINSDSKSLSQQQSCLFFFEKKENN